MSLNVRMKVPASIPALIGALEGLVETNQAIMSDSLGGDFPPLYESGVRYREERGTENWKTADELLADGYGDCEDLMGYRVSELRRAGESASPDVIRTKRGTFHAIVRRGDGTHEDPSKILVEKEVRMRQCKPKVTLREVGDHYVGSIELPLTDGRTITCHQLGSDSWSALRRVAGEAGGLLQNPTVMALLPPKVQLAMLMVSKISDMSPAALRMLISDKRTPASAKALAVKVLERIDDDDESTIGIPVERDSYPRASTAAYARPTTTARSGGTAGGVVTRDHRASTATDPQRTNPDMRVPITTYSPTPTTRVPLAPVSVTPVQPAPVVTRPAPVPIAPGNAPIVSPGATYDPATGMAWTPDASPQGGHWERTRGQAPVPVAPPGYPPLAPPGYPPGAYPPPMVDQFGYPIQQGQPYPYGYPYQAPYQPQYNPMYADPYGYQMPIPMPMVSPYGAYPYGYNPYEYLYQSPPFTVQPQPISDDEAAAINVWGAESFADGSFPGWIQ